MKTRVEITLEIETSNDNEYEEVMSDIESSLKIMDGVTSVDVGIGESE